MPDPNEKDFAVKLDVIVRAQLLIDSLRPGAEAQASRVCLKEDEAFWFLRAVEDGIVVFRPCDTKCHRARRWGVAGSHEFVTPSGQLRHLYSNPIDSPRLNREYVPHIAAYAKAILADGYIQANSSFSRYRTFSRDAITKKAGTGYETDAEFYAADGSIWLQLEAKRDGRQVDVIASQIDRIGDLSSMPAKTAKEIEYVLDLAPKYLWLVGPGSVDPARHVFAVEVTGSSARFTRIPGIPPIPLPLTAVLGP